jgi:Phosphodiester glycosidase
MRRIPWTRLTVMNINTAQTNRDPVAHPAVFLAALILATSSLGYAGPLPGPWIPIFKGIDHAVGTNDPSVSGNFPELQVVHCVRIDLTDPDIRLLPTPRAANWASGSRETLTLSVPDFLKQQGLQIVADANYYNANPGGSDPTSEGISCDVYGLQISAGTVVSSADDLSSGDSRYVSLLFTTNNQPIFDFTNHQPGTNTAGIYTAITGFYPLVTNGVQISDAVLASSYPDSFIHGLQPRTAYGVSKDNRYLYLVTIDGRQGGYSDGAYDHETGYWMLQFGAWNAINMDGGGSTALYMSDSAGNPVGLNHSSYLPGYGRERYVGSHFGVYAKPLAGFFNDVQVAPGDTAAMVTWTTIVPSSTQIKYGLTPGFGLASVLDSTLVTNHTVLLSNLSPGTGYYFAALTKIGATPYVSSNFFFTTTNFATTNALFDFTNVWSYVTANLDGVNWTAPAYDDSSWTGSGPGALWVDTRGFFNPAIPISGNTQMPDPGTGFPYITYYLRTHFTFTNQVSGVGLLFEDYVDDGAVFYLNGTEIYRLRMSPAPAVISNSTLAAGYPCSGDATCPDYFSIFGPLATNLVAGDNVLAAEVHNYNAQSPDITFGLALNFTEPFTPSPAMNVQAVPGLTGATITWTTADPATTQIEYGLTTNLGLTSAVDLAMGTNHTVLLTNLSPMTGYYFAPLSIIDQTLYVSTNFFFTTLSSQPNPPVLKLSGANTTWTLTWTNSGFTVQQAAAPTGPWTSAPGPSSLSPYSLTNSGPAMFFRLRH